ncbi:DNA alkylation repair protein [Schaalia suimastitidis]|uniref:DNA alkylation repair protein n=1 Tax=Schaalia suimastitidis TaxID=121163 RepID=UPI0003FA79F0|nr:DNA alkylation repair protein [Schaalia suimastitidis]
MFREEIEALADPDNAAFIAKLMPTVDPETVLGIRTPILRSLAKEIWRHRRDDAFTFFAEVPHHYFDENQLHAFLITQEKDFNTCLAHVEAFVPYIDNWATCDSLNPKALGRDPQMLEAAARRWIAHTHLYTRRFGVGILMSHFLTEHFRTEFLDLVGAIDTTEYYLQMMVAWYFAEACAKQEEAALPWLLEDRGLDMPIRRKAIQKALESYRVCDEAKVQLRLVRAGLPRAPLAKPN